MNTKNYVETNSDFLIKTNYIYPPKNTQIFEEYFLNRFLLENPKTNRIYLPIQWTSYYHSKKINLNGLQNFLYDLPKNEKYFTIVQWDDNIMNDVNHLDLKIFAQGGNGLYKDKSYAIPLNCVFTSVNSLKKDIFASFVGAISGRHKIREELRNMYGLNDKYFISEGINYEKFREIMSRTLFSLCPRGYGQTSFRIFESLKSGSIPVYIYDEPFMPFKNEFNFDDIHPDYIIMESLYGGKTHEDKDSNINVITPF